MLSNGNFSVAEALRKVARHDMGWKQGLKYLAYHSEKLGFYSVGIRQSAEVFDLESNMFDLFKKGNLEILSVRVLS